MSPEINKISPKFISFNYLKYDLSGGLVVFLVALPLCLGIALASGAPLFSGLISGVVGGIVISILSGSQMSVSGPAAGLTVIVLSAITTLGSYEAFLLSVIVGGMFQILFGFLKAGTIANYIPSSVIKGMLAAIGIILIIKQIPHAFGYDVDYEGDFTFIQPDHENSFSEVINAINKSNLGALIISAVSFVILLIWDRPFLGKVKIIPAPLVVVVVGIILNKLFEQSHVVLMLNDNHLVNIPRVETGRDIVYLFTLPDFKQFANVQIYIIGFTLALVASIETLLSIEAVDKLDPLRRVTPANRELKAQGIGNMVSGLLGGLPITAVIVRGSANVNSGAKTKTSAFFHGIFLLLAVILVPGIINQIPLAALATILIVVGFKLTSPKLYVDLYKIGWDQFIPFVLTIIAIVLTDLLKGIGLGVIIGLVFVLARNLKKPFTFHRGEYYAGETIRIVFPDEVTFLNKVSVLETLENLPENSHVLIDGRNSNFIDYDVIETISGFTQHAHLKNITYDLKGINKNYKKQKQQNIRVSQQSYDSLLINNRNWVDEKLGVDINYFKKLSEGQTPQYLFIGCSDSRITPNEITGTTAGELFMHRNIANLVSEKDQNLMSVLQYAIEVLQVKHVIVCGHYGCGGIIAANSKKEFKDDIIDKWLLNIHSVKVKHEEKLNKIEDENQRVNRLVELNVKEQVFNLCSTSVIQNALRRGQNINVHGWVYDINTGFIIDLNIMTVKWLKNIAD
jgi:carbonic anhydrase